MQMRISDAAAASGCHLETIRYYERVGLMPQPTRTGSRYRTYGAADVERLRFISRGRALGFSLESIRSLLRLNDDPDMSCSDVDALARTHLSDICQRIDELTRMATELERVITQCVGGDCGRCAILSVLRHSREHAAPSAGSGCCRPPEAVVPLSRLQRP